METMAMIRYHRSISKPNPIRYQSAATVMAAMGAVVAMEQISLPIILRRQANIFIIMMVSICICLAALQIALLATTDYRYIIHQRMIDMTRSLAHVAYRRLRQRQIVTDSYWVCLRHRCLAITTINNNSINKRIRLIISSPQSIIDLCLPVQGNHL